MKESTPLVGVIMGSQSDWETLSRACDTLNQLEVPHEARIVSAHRTPDLLFEYAGSAARRGLKRSKATSARCKGSCWTPSPGARRSPAS